MFSRLRSFLTAASSRSTFERDMDDELRSHLASRADDLMRSGLSPLEARRRARLQFGNPEAYQDRYRESRQLHLVDDLRLDLRFRGANDSQERLSVSGRRGDARALLRDHGRPADAGPPVSA